MPGGRSERWRPPCAFLPLGAARPRLLLLDEPTAGIAQREAEALGPLLRSVHAETGTTVLLVEHDVPLTTSLCDRLVVMEAGRVVSAGPTASHRSSERSPPDRSLRR